MNIRNRKLLVGTFYRPPNSSPIVLSNIENSIGLAIDSGIADIVVSADFNFNVINPSSANKILDICKQYNLHQLIKEPTHFTEYSSSLIDLILVSNLQSVELSGVEEPFLSRDIRYHCPVFSIFRLKKAVQNTFKRDIWTYDQGDYESLRKRISEFDWNSIHNDDVNIYAKTFSDKLLEMTKECVPNRTITVRPHDLPWMNGNIRKLMRKRNRLYKKYKTNKTGERFEAYKKVRNEVINLLRKSKQDYIDSLANKLKGPNLSSSDYWKTLKSFINSSNSTAIPPLLHDDTYYSDNAAKANFLNDFFVEQTVIDENNASLPAPIFPKGACLNTVSVTPEG